MILRQLLHEVMLRDQDEQQLPVFGPEMHFAGRLVDSGAMIPRATLACRFRPVISPDLALIYIIYDLCP